MAVSSPDAMTSGDRLVGDQRTAARTLWVFVYLTVAFLIVGSLTGSNAASHGSEIKNSLYAATLLLLLGSVYAVSVMSRFVSPARAMRAVGGRSGAFKLALLLLVLIQLAAVAMTVMPLQNLFRGFGDGPDLTRFAVPAAVYISMVLYTIALISLAMRVHAEPDVAGSAASMNEEASKDNLGEHGLEAIRAVVTRVPGETDAQRVSRVSPLIVADRVDYVLDRIRDRDTTQVAVSPFNLEVTGTVGSAVIVAGSRLISADGCESVTYTLLWTADMMKVDGAWKLHGVRGAETQGE